VVAVHGDVVCCRSKRRKAAVGSGSGARELAEVLEERDIEVKAMLLRARDRRFKHHDGLPSVTTRWRPASARRKPWRARGRTAERGYGSGQR
jgi:hypothetical protein